MTEKGKSTITVPQIKSGEAALVKIDKPEETGVKQIAIAVKNAVANIRVVVSKVDKPNVPAAPDKIFGYIQIDKVNITDADISSVSIDFHVDKAWLNANKIDKSKVVLNRFANGWVALSTKQLEESATSALYRAESPGLSVFAITGKELAAATPAATPRATPAAIQVPQVVKDYGMWIVAFILAAVILGYLYYHGHHHVKKAAKFVYDFKK